MTIYLDNAATSFPKPAAVYDAVDNYNRNLGAPLGRGAYAGAMQVHSVVQRCRKRAADLLGAESPERIAFTFNGTDGLNLALHGLLKPGDHVVTSDVEHNSVRRPLRELQDRRGIEVSWVAAEETGRVEPTAIRDALRPETKLIALIHASNVTGVLQPIADVGTIAREAGIWFLLDAAQTAGHWPIDLAGLPVDLLACSGHKGLLGPLGTGLIYLRPGMEEHLLSFRQGGTGSRSEDDHQPDRLPEKYEAGNHNVPGLCGLEAALGYLAEQTVAAIQVHEAELTGRLLDGLNGIDGVQIFGPKRGDGRVGVVSIGFDGYEPATAANILDEAFHIQTRAGLHCAPGVHRRLGTLEAGGTVRFSIGPFTTAEEIDSAITAVGEIAATGG